MTFTEYQNEAWKTALPAARLPAYMILGLANEAGEVAGKMKKFLRGDYGSLEMVEAMAAELGDVLWYVAGVATQYGLSLDTIAQMNIEKLQDRRQRGVLQGNGDTR